MNDATFRSDAAHDRRAEDEELLWWPDGLPHWTWSFFFQARIFPYSTASFMNLLNTAVLREQIDPKRFTVKDLKHAQSVLGIGPSERTMRDLLNTFDGYFWQESNSNVYNGDAVSKYDSCKKRGRPSKHWALFPRDIVLFNAMDGYARPRITEDCYKDIVPIWTDEMFQGMGYSEDQIQSFVASLNDSTQPLRKEQTKAMNRSLYLIKRWFDRLNDPCVLALPEKWPLVSIADCRMAVIHAKVKAEPGPVWPYSRLMHELGCSRSTIADILDRVPINVEHRFETLWLTSPDNITELVQHKAKEWRGAPVRFTLHDDHNLHNETYDRERSPEVLAKQMAEGWKVSITFQLTSDLQIEGDSPPNPSRKRRHPNDGERLYRANQERRYYKTGYDPVFLSRALWRMESKALKDGLPLLPEFEEIKRRFLSLSTVRNDSDDDIQTIVSSSADHRK